MFVLQHFKVLPEITLKVCGRNDGHISEVATIYRWSH